MSSIELIRPTSAPIHPLIHHRWSPRSMIQKPLSTQQIQSLFEAARMAPSSYNAQPWRFIYATYEDSSWESFLNLLIPFNQSWCKNASMLVIICSHTQFEHNQKPSLTHSFDTGAAWMNLALEGFHQGLVIHGMQGFNYQNAAKLIQLPENYVIEAMIAVGVPGPVESLPKDLQDKETPSPRRPLSEILYHESF